ncbi:MAG: hypothetical protein ACK5OO_06120 [Cyclobacteriaceae bacterium]
MDKTLFERHKEFKEAIGSFILAFSELEYGLGIICSFTEFNLLRREQVLPNCLGLTLENKKKLITEYIYRYEPDIKPIWEKIRIEIDFLNTQRRFIAHGIERVYINDSIRAKVKSGSQMEEKLLTLSDLHEWTERLHTLNSGENGIIGSFYIDFVRRSVNRWNGFVTDEYKIIYLLNDKPISDWQGKRRD